MNFSLDACALQNFEKSRAFHRDGKIELYFGSVSEIFFFVCNR